MIKHKPIIQKTILLLFGLISGLVIAELAAGKYSEVNKLTEKLNYAEGKIDKNKEAPIGIYDKDLGWGLKPNSQGSKVSSEYEALYSVNSNGLRDKEILLGKPTNVFRILALGESNVFGQCVNYGKRFSEIIENYLNNVEIINMGVWSFGADQSFLQLQRDGFKFSPNLIILFVIGDFLERCKQPIRDNNYKPMFVLDNTKNNIVLLDLNAIRVKLPDQAMQNRKEYEVNRNKKEGNSLIKKSNLWVLLSYNRRMRNVRERLEKIDRDRQESIQRSLNEHAKYNSKYTDDDFRKLIFLLLKKYRDLANAHSVNFMLVYMDEGKGYLANYIQKPCEELGIDYFDLSDILYQASKIKPLRFRTDYHYNDFAHKIIGEYTGDYIAKKYNLQKAKGHVH